MSLLNEPSPAEIVPPLDLVPDLVAVPDLHPDPMVEFEHDIAIVGLGYVGLPTALAYHHAGSKVLALDISTTRRSSIELDDVDLIDRDHERLRAALSDERFEITGDATRIRAARNVIICVPTPVDQHLVPDLSALRAACTAAVDNSVRGQLLLLTSTTYVGCTDDLLVAPLSRKGLGVGHDIFVAFSAERIDPGSDDIPQEEVPRVVGGATPACAERAVEVLSGYADSVHRVRSLGVAEMTKLLENTFRAVNIALANEFADVCRTLGIDVTAVIDAAATKPYGFMPFSPGPGVGGHCIPCDPHYLLWQLRKDRVDAPVISQAMQQIAHRPTTVVDRVRELLADRGRSLRGARVIVVGVAYKPNVADLRESPAVEIIEQLRSLGASVGYVDPRVPRVVLRDGSALEPIPDPESYAASLVLLHTVHDTADLSWIAPRQLVLDATYRAESLGSLVSL